MGALVAKPIKSILEKIWETIILKKLSLSSVNTCQQKNLFKYFTLRDQSEKRFEIKI